MEKISKPIVFFGSGPVASASLDSLAKVFEIASVITKPVAKHSYSSAPVIDLSKKLGLMVHTATNKQELDLLFISGAIPKTQAAVLVDYGIIIGKKVIDYFPLGIINSHFSLLPEWRGADPITFAILSGQSKTGVSLMLVVEAMDEGPVIKQKSYILAPSITTPQLTDSLVILSNSMLHTDLPAYLNGEINPVPQDLSIEPTYSRKLTKNDGLIEWRKPATVIEREIRAFLEWPKCHTAIKNTNVIITKSHVVQQSGKPGEMMNSNSEIIIYAGQEALAIDMLKPLGRNEMTGKSFLAGHKS